VDREGLHRSRTSAAQPRCHQQTLRKNKTRTRTRTRTRTHTHTHTQPPTHTHTTATYRGVLGLGGGLQVAGERVGGENHIDADDGADEARDNQGVKGIQLGLVDGVDDGLQEDGDVAADDLVAEAVQQTG
jgi:hypothetical protein